MNSYATYRMAETIRVLIFLTLSILVFNFYPVTAVMIVILSLLNDIPIMMIAYDNTKLPQKPVRWNMRKVMTLAILLGIVGVFVSFILFYIAQEVLLLDRATIQTLIFLKLAVAGHMTIYHARAGEHPFWARPLPAAALFWTSEITQFAGTLVAVYGIFMQPIGWTLAALVWGYALVVFLFTNYIKIYFYKVVNHSGIMFHR